MGTLAVLLVALLLLLKWMFVVFVCLQVVCLRRSSVPEISCATTVSDPALSTWRAGEPASYSHTESYLLVPLFTHPWSQVKAQIFCSGRVRVRWRGRLIFTAPWMQREENSKEQPQQASFAATRFRKLWRVFCPSNRRELSLSLTRRSLSGFPASSLQTRLGCHYRSVRERAAWQAAALLMAVSFCVRLEDVLFPETGTFHEHKQHSYWGLVTRLMTLGGTARERECEKRQRE